MLEFNYQGRNQQGDLISGKLVAASADAVATQLLQEGITPIEIGTQRQASQLKKLLSKDVLPKRVSLTELMLFCRQMHTLIKAGIPLDSALQRLAETTRAQQLAKTIRAIRERISAGETLASALRHYPKVFPTLFVSIIRVGETSGRLDQAFLRLLDYLTLEESTTRRFKTVIRYPIFVVVTLLIALLVINAMVIPAFAKLFSNYREQLPLATRILIDTSNFITTQWPWLLAGFICFVASFWYYVRTPAGRLRWHRFQRKIPVVGSILSRIHIIRFTRITAMVVRSGVAIHEGLALVASATGNAYVQEKIQSMQQLLERGGTLATVIKSSGLFSPIAWQMILVGEETGNLDEMLEEVAEFYEREVDYELARLSDALEPILLMGIGVMVLILALGVFLPMWDVAQLMRGH